jgi:hypothetical protein
VKARGHEVADALFAHLFVSVLSGGVEEGVTTWSCQTRIVIHKLEARLGTGTLVQVLLEEPNSVPLRLLKRSLLCGVVGVTARSKAVLNAREVDVLPGNVQLR